MLYCLAVWCPHSAASCLLVAVEDSLNSSSTPTAREWQVPAASLSKGRADHPPDGSRVHLAAWSLDKSGGVLQSEEATEEEGGKS